jgi:hypothetical protein
MSENKLQNNFPKMPELRVSKNGYEIRADILAMAKDLVTHDYGVKFQGWEVTATRDEKTGQIVSKVGMPEVPGLEQVLATAEKMYNFVAQQGVSFTKK